MPSTYAFLRDTPLFSELSDEALELLGQDIENVRLQAGETLFEEGSIGRQAYVICEGQIEIIKMDGGHEIQLAVRRPGEMIGEISLLESAPRSATARALSEASLYSINQEQFHQLLDHNPHAARTLLHTVIARQLSTEMMLNQRQKMAQLGTLTAGIAHELNNPASAVKRGAEQFKTAFERFQEQAERMLALDLTPEQAEALVALARQVRPRAEILPLRPVERSDRERALESWLEEAGTPLSWEAAPLLVSLGFDAQSLREALKVFPPVEHLPAALAWVIGSAELASLAHEISQGASRISETVRALKSYVYLDQAPVQPVNIHEGLENTLVILRHKLKQGVEVRREYDPALPLVQANGSELNQVWTNIIDNAIDAMDGQGAITLRTALDDGWIVVDITDTGPGIPQEIQARLFSPFFTTKPIGKGTGLGLNISHNIIHRHGGEIRVSSQPGETHFEITLPLDGAKPRGGEGLPARASRG